MKGIKEVIYKCELSERELGVLIDAVDEFKEDVVSESLREECIALRRQLSQLYLGKEFK